MTNNFRKLKTDSINNEQDNERNSLLSFPKYYSFLYNIYNSIKYIFKIGCLNLSYIY